MDYKNIDLFNYSIHTQGLLNGSGAPGKLLNLSYMLC